MRELLGAIQDDLLEKARRHLAENTTVVGDYEEFKRVMSEKRGFLVAGWCGDADCEARIKDETKATIRCLPDAEFRSPGRRTSST